MANSSLALLESALRQRKLDRTLTTAHPAEHTAVAAAPSGIAALDRCLHGGLPRGQLSELTGPAASGRTTVLLHTLAAMTRGGELAALVDTCDRLDVDSAAAAGMVLNRLLWVRGEAAPLDRRIDRAVKAAHLILQAGGFGAVALDLADVPARVLTQLPMTTWLRLQRTIEGSETACLLVVPEPLARSAGGLTVVLSGAARWAGTAARSRRLTGIDVAVRVVSPRRRFGERAEFQAVASDATTAQRQAPARDFPASPSVRHFVNS
jgi:hypothetical protein